MLNNEDDDVKRRPKGRRKATIHITVPHPLKAYALRVADERGESVSQFITDILRREAEKNA